MNFGGTFAGKRVLVTGDTGFKGGWLCEWLLMLGAEVTGIGLAPNTTPALFEQLGLAGKLDHRLLDIRNEDAVTKLVTEIQPDIVLHLAAQPLVRLSYEIPVETYSTNVMGTVHLLNSLRQLSKPCAVVCITSDKCYDNRESEHSYAEDDPMGGHDPYSSSKGACELVIDSFRKSFFNDPMNRGIAVASARAGNVIGGGDWAEDRILPDCVRALMDNRVIPVRNKNAVRPWQHVLEPLGGYLLLAAEMWQKLAGNQGISTDASIEQLCSAFNFGPDTIANRPVEDLVNEVLECWPGEWADYSDPDAPHEANLLKLSIEKAKSVLNWEPRWGFKDTVDSTIRWYRSVATEGSDPWEITREQIDLYSKNHD
ncbi:MAG: CDP-glucose 4,6-dehydratase [Puniceicoccaceae bacterium]